jgi:hypothetical protein
MIYFLENYHIVVVCSFEENWKRYIRASRLRGLFQRTRTNARRHLQIADVLDKIIFCLQRVHFLFANEISHAVIL